MNIAHSANAFVQSIHLQFELMTNRIFQSLTGVVPNLKKRKMLILHKTF